MFFDCCLMCLKELGMHLHSTKEKRTPKESNNYCYYHNHHHSHWFSYWRYFLVYFFLPPPFSPHLVTITSLPSPLC